MELWEQKGATVIVRILKEDLRQNLSSFAIEKEEMSFSISTGEGEQKRQVFITKGLLGDYFRASTRHEKTVLMERIVEELRKLL